MNALILSVLTFSFGFLIAKWKNDETFVDVIWPLNFLVLAIYIVFKMNHHFFLLVILFLISLWAFRLGSFLFIRNKKMEKDKRYVQMMNAWNPKFHWIQVYFKIYFLQAMISLIVSLSFLHLLIGVEISAEIEAKSNQFFLIIGGTLSLFGFGFESIADHQKFKFKKDNPHKHYKGGLFKFCRYPNYFGEILFWWGIYICSLSISFNQWSPVGALGPLSLSLIIIFISGIKMNEDAKKNNLDYLEYKQRTPALIPKII